MAKAFVCYAHRIGAGFRRSIYRPTLGANPATSSDTKAQITSLTNFKTYLTTVLSTNTLVPIVGSLDAATVAGITAAVDAYATGVNGALKNSIKVSILSYSPSAGAPVANFVRLVCIKNGVKTVTDLALRAAPAEQG